MNKFFFYHPIYQKYSLFFYFLFFNLTLKIFDYRFIFPITLLNFYPNETLFYWKILFVLWFIYSNFILYSVIHPYPPHRLKNLFCYLLFNYYLKSSCWFVIKNLASILKICLYLDFILIIISFSFEYLEKNIRDSEENSVLLYFLFDLNELFMNI